MFLHIQSIVAPIGSLTLVTNVLFAHYWLKETVVRTDITVCYWVVNTVCVFTFLGHVFDNFGECFGCLVW